MESKTVARDVVVKVYAYEAGDLAWLLMAIVLVLFMIPGMGFFYAGLARRKSALSLIFVSLMSLATTFFQWFFWGFSLTYSRSSGPFIGNLQHFGLRHVLDRPSIASSRIPDLLFAVYHGLFSAVTVAIATGALAERGRILPCIIFMFIWATVVYDPLAYWTWNPNGWSHKMGVLDFAGGTPVHISSGAAALAYSIGLGKRRGHGTQELNYRPHNVGYIAIGTVFLWIGWFGFNVGSTLGTNMRSVVAAASTMLSSCVGGLTWVLLDYIQEGKWSAVGFCSGVVVGLVVMTPGSGFVPVWAGLVFGSTGAISSNYATRLKFVLHIDDALDIFAIHGIGGFVGNICTGIFASKSIAALDPDEELILGGWIDGHWIQLAYQLADSISGGLYSFIITSILLFILSFIPGLRLRIDESSEIRGVDETEMGEFAYDYVEFEREVPLVVDEIDEIRNHDSNEICQM